jgi:squalene synthase HpnC
LNVEVVHGTSVITPPTVDELPRRSEVMEQAGRENFTVANAVLGRERQHQLRAIYGFARLVDDVGDEAPGDRAALLDLVEEELDRVYGDNSPRHPVMIELGVAVRAGSLPRGPFQRLIEANRLDQRTTHYDTFEQLLGYCQLSAAPVGELVLHVFGAASSPRIALSDRICAGLQITEHLQDVGEDFRRGRVYLPREDLVRFGCDNEDLSAPSTARRRALIAFEAQRAHQLLSSGAPLARTLSLRPRIAVAGFVAGGRAALAALPEVQPFGGRRSRRSAFPRAFTRAVMGR